MAQDKNKGAKKKPGFFKTLRDAFTIAKRTYRHLGWWLALAGLAGLGIGILLGFLTKSWIAWTVFGILLMLLLPMLLLTRAVRSASYAQLDGMPGATSAILDSLLGGQANRTGTFQRAPPRFRFPAHRAARRGSRRRRPYLTHPQAH